VTTDDVGRFVGPDEGQVLTNPLGGRMVLKALDRDTGGAYSLHENVLPPNSPGPRPHIHHQHEEAFYVLEGELTMRMGEQTVTAPAGSFVVIPPAREFLVLFLDVSPHLPGPQMYWEKLPKEAKSPAFFQQRLHNANRMLEDHIRELTNGKPRGFVVAFHYPEADLEPLIEFHRLSDEVGKGFADTAPDLVQLVRSYDPHTAFILFKAQADIDAGMLEDVEISEQQYMFPAPAGWAPNIVG
jgi:hypothetical protein